METLIKKERQSPQPKSQSDHDAEDFKSFQSEHNNSIDFLADEYGMEVEKNKRDNMELDEIEISRDFRMDKKEEEEEDLSSNIYMPSFDKKKEELIPEQLVQIQAPMEIEHTDKEQIQEAHEERNLVFEHLMEKIEVRFDHNEKNIQNIIFYGIKGMYDYRNELIVLNTVRRYSEFQALYTLICDKFYDKVLPILPEKNKLLKLTGDKESITKRADSLKIFIAKLLAIDGVFDYEPVRVFFTKKSEFLLLCNSPEYKAILDRTSILESLKSFKDDIMDYFKGKKTYDKGYYDNFNKEIETLYFFVRNLIKDLNELNVNAKKIFQNLNNLADGSSKILKSQQDNDYMSYSEVFVNKCKEIRKDNKELKGLLDTLNVILLDILACKNTLSRKDNIYKSYHHQSLEINHIMKEVQDSSGREYEVEKKHKLSVLKQKIDQMEIRLKEDLDHVLKGLKRDLKNIINVKLKGVFAGIYNLSN